jgi:chemosensory pili system protein ChpB (putative protein-glutamate methylesterase)
MPDQFAMETAPRVVLLARAGKAADNLADALRQAGAELVMTADPSTTNEAALRAHRPQVVLVALEPSIENALDKLDTLLDDPTLTVIYDEADLAAHRAGWDAARWVRHLSAKLRHDSNVLPPGTESDQDWQPSPGQIPKPAAAYADVDLTVFTREAVASADSVPSDGMQADLAPTPKDALSLDPSLLDAIPAAKPVQPPPLPPAPPHAADIASFEEVLLESMLLESMPLESMPLESMPLESRSVESVSLESMPLESMSLESLSLESLPPEDLPFESLQLESMRSESTQFGSTQPQSMSNGSTQSSVTPMMLDDDAFFLEELSLGDASPTDGGDSTVTTFEGRFDTMRDFDIAPVDLDSVPTASVASRAFDEDVMSFEDLIANSIAAAEAAPSAAAPPSEPPRALGDLSLAPVDESPAVRPTPAAVPRTHDLSALEARISSLSLVDLDDGTSEKPGMFGLGGNVTGVVLVEAGLGGPDPARQLLSSLPAEFPAVVLVRLHLQGGRYDRLVAQMERAAALPVALAQSGGGANPGTIYFLPDGIGLAARRGGLEFTADGAPAETIFDALPPGDSAVVFLSGSDLQLVDTAMATAARGTLLIAQSPEDCYDGTACAELRKRGAASGLPAELAGRLASRWPS